MQLCIAYSLLLVSPVKAGPPSYKYDERDIGKLVVDAINAGTCMLCTYISISSFIRTGGDAHTDINGVRYRRDPLSGDHNSVDSDFGRRMSVQKAPPEDEILYQVRVLN